MKQIRKAAALTLSMAMVVSAMGTIDSEAATAPKFAKKSVSVKKDKTVTVKVKNIQAKATVTWSVKNKKVIKIVKKAKTSCKVKGLKVGSTKLYCSVKPKGKAAKKINCTVKVTGDAKATKAPTETSQATVAATATPTAIVTQAPTPSPSPTASPSPTPLVPMTPAPTYEASTWTSSWGTAEEKCNLKDQNQNMPSMPKDALEDTTIRQIIRVTTTGRAIRFRLSNQYGDVPVTIKSMHIAKQVNAKKSGIDLATDTVVTYNGQEEFSIPKGEVIQTDPVDFSISALENVAVSCYFGSTPAELVTGHRGARATTYQIAGNQVSEETFSTKKTKTTTAWYFLADASLETPAGSRAVVCFGDSITDGFGTDAYFPGRGPDLYIRWGDYFAKRLQENEKTKLVSVLNEGIGSNSMMGAYPTDAGKDRFRRDLLEHDNVEYCIILFGVNDLNKLQNTNKYNELKPEYEKMVKLCHDNNIKVYGAPILPFGTSDYYSENSEKVRTMINEWMRSAESGMDGIIDFDKALADPSDPTKIQEKYTHNDGLHPYDGYDVMADAIDLKLFEK